jgi:hypothetical protein
VGVPVVVSLLAAAFVSALGALAVHRRHRLIHRSGHGPAPATGVVTHGEEPGIATTGIGAHGYEDAWATLAELAAGRDP